MQRELLRYRASLVGIQTGIKNRVRTILAKSNITHGFSDLFGKQGKDFLNSLLVSEIYRMALDGYLLVLDELEQQIKAVNKRIGDSVRDGQEVKLLMTILGVGCYSALLIRSEIGDINRFPSAKRLCSYASVIPSTYASGNTVFHGHITKQGSKWLGWIMAEVMTHCVNRPGHLQRFYSKLERRKGKKIAKAAAERKHLECIYHMLRNGKSYKEIEKIASAWGKTVTCSGR